MATNHHADADVAECCVFPDAAALDGTPIAFDFTLDVNLTAALGRVVGSTAEQAAAGWQEELADDLACALRIPSNQIDASVVSATDLLAATSPSDGHFAVRVHIDSAQLAPSRRRLDAVDTKPAETAEQITARLVAQLRDARSAIWKGVLRGTSTRSQSRRRARRRRCTRATWGGGGVVHARHADAADVADGRRWLDDREARVGAACAQRRWACVPSPTRTSTTATTPPPSATTCTTSGATRSRRGRTPFPDMDTGDDAKYPAVSADGQEKLLRQPARHGPAALPRSRARPARAHLSPWSRRPTPTTRRSRRRRWSRGRPTGAEADDEQVRRAPTARRSSFRVTRGWRAPTSAPRTTRRGR